jgi:hypothetical protein
MHTPTPVAAVPQLPPVTRLHADVLDDGVQYSHPLFAVELGAWKAPPIQQPGVQLAGFPAHTSPAEQLAFAPSVLVHDDVLEPGWQLSHGSFGFVVPDATIPMPAMSHWLPQTPSSQIAAPPQLWPFGAVVHSDVLVSGSQSWHPPFVVAPES